MRKLAMTLALALSLITPAAAEAAPKQIKLATYGAVGSPLEKAITLMKKDIVEKTNGRYDLTPYLAYSFGSHDTAFQGARLGTMEIVVDTTSNMSVYVPELAAFDMPYLMPSDKAIEATLRGEPGKKAMELIEKKGVRPMCLINGTWRVLINTKNWKNLDAIKGAKVRSTSSKTHIAALNSLGVSAIPMPGAEMYTGLQQGVVDGADPEFNSYRTNRYVDVAKYCFDIQAMPVLIVSYMSARWWKALPDADKKIFDGIFKDFQNNCKKFYDEQIASDRKLAVEKEGVVITPLTPEDKARAMEMGKAAYKALTPAQAEFAKCVSDFITANKLN